MTTEAFWAGEFGDDYLKRNQVDWVARMPFWADVLSVTRARSMYEVGANAGWNLSALRRLNQDIGLHGVEINDKAALRALMCGFPVSAGSAVEDLAQYDDTFDVVFTCGVLIHIAPDDLPGLMKSIVDASARYVLAVEYADEQEVEIEYRGHAGKLWRRPFGKLYEAMGLRLVRTWDDAPGFDRCTAWLLDKGGK